MEEAKGKVFGTKRLVGVGYNAGVILDIMSHGQTSDQDWSSFRQGHSDYSSASEMCLRRLNVFKHASLSVSSGRSP